MRRGRNRAFRREVQVVFQDPYLSLNPRLSVGTLIEEPLVIQGVSRKQRKQRVAGMLEKVRLDPEFLTARPSQLSGGQRQRVCIARSLIVEPRFLISDEPVSALDLSVQAQIIDLLSDLKEQFGLTMLFVSHDLELVQFLADEVGVMYCGRLVETGTPSQLFDNPVHPYTRSLLAAVPNRLANEGALQSDLGIRNAASDVGCPYRLNCDLADMKCQYETPPLIMVNPDHRVACYKALRDQH